jgi:hypothetical protein
MMGITQRLGVFKKRMLTRIFGPKRNEATGNCIMRSFLIFTVDQIN